MSKYFSLHQYVLTTYISKNWVNPCLFFFIFVISVQLRVNKKLPKTGFEQRICGVGSDCATTTALTLYLHWNIFYLLVRSLSHFLYRCSSYLSFLQPILSLFFIQSFGLLSLSLSLSLSLWLNLSHTLTLRLCLFTAILFGWVDSEMIVTILQNFMDKIFAKFFTIFVLGNVKPFEDNVRSVWIS